LAETSDQELERREIEKILVVNSVDNNIERYRIKAYENFIYDGLDVF
jgi:hypothetical protein